MAEGSTEDDDLVNYDINDTLHEMIAAAKSQGKMNDVKLVAEAEARMDVHG